MRLQYVDYVKFTYRKRFMRRKDRDLGAQSALSIIDDCQYGVLSTIDDKGMVFTIPISIVRDKMSIFVHGAKAGIKARLFKNGRDVSIVCVSYNKIPDLNQEQLKSIQNNTKELASKVFTTEYKSAIAQTKVYEVTQDEIKMKALRLLCEKYTPEYMQAFDVAAKVGLNYTNIYEFKIQSVSAKAKILS